MDKTLQDLVWSILPKEFKEEVKKIYETAVAKADIMTYATIERLFGIHNLTSDAEGEEMLIASRKRVQEMYAHYDNISNDPNRPKDYIESIYEYADGVTIALDDLFGSKCLPDEPASNEPQPAEPKFKRGDKVTVRANAVSAYPRPGIIIGQTDKPGQWIVRVEMADGDIPYKLSESDLEPYTEPTDESRNLSQETANCDKQFDNILKDSFAEHNRLHIATEMAAAIIQSTDDITIDNKQVQKNLENVAKVAFLFADALISECEKGGES